MVVCANLSAVYTLHTVKPSNKKLGTDQINFRKPLSRLHISLSRRAEQLKVLPTLLMHCKFPNISYRKPSYIPKHFLGK